MNSLGVRAARILLFSILAVSASLKIRHFVVLGDRTPSNPLLTYSAFLYGVITIELVLAVVLATPWYTVAGRACIALAVLGVLVQLYGALSGTAISCGCLGRTPLSVLQHLALSCAVVDARLRHLAQGGDAIPTTHTLRWPRETPRPQTQRALNPPVR